MAKKTRFWTVAWSGSTSFATRMPELFSLTTKPAIVVVGAARTHAEGRTVWDLHVGNPMNQVQEVQRSMLLQEIGGVKLSVVDDELNWKDGEFKFIKFTVKRMTIRLQQLLHANNEGGTFGDHFPHTQKLRNRAGPKAMFLVWLVIRDKIPTRDRLFSREIV